MDRFGEYKPVVITALILNAAFHHSLLLIPHQETPGVMPSAYVMQHPITGDVEVNRVSVLKRSLSELKLKPPFPFSLWSNRDIIIFRLNE